VENLSPRAFVFYPANLAANQNASKCPTESVKVLISFPDPSKVEERNVRSALNVIYARSNINPLAEITSPESNLPDRAPLKVFNRQLLLSPLIEIAAAEEAQMETRPIILLVDDNADVLEIFELMLSSKGFSVTTAHSAEQAITLLETIHPIAIITDIMMPDMSGVDLIRHIRSTAEYATLPIVAVTALGARHLEAAKQAGANMVLNKPVDLTLLADNLMDL
jgi:CheY-like chemotaxis protein